ncbi:uncharacterized protein B0P05DRAFT_559130 [Gilbertella persicaria]|uniref:Uncharacterized protein n=1 Tax=Rhizopus stolonifer TaxID=4846 RepID=A0A367KJ58_RHIST|nr:uncharacterized protein B0P05DRAFT_559130 [Gilbertella persicaria]KAI8058940.1 hypothetical protein B0P05DRAFT_559130 [Gilbertella persicaria]RCI02180.1 hypothetical protein CU098_011145 [Rhizopus stolonifer]
MSLLTNKEKDLLATFREQLWLKRQIEQLEQDQTTDKELEELTIPPEATDQHVEESIAEYKRHIDSLRTNLDMLYQFNKSKELVQEKIYTQHYTTNVLYPEPSDHQQTELNRQTQDKLKERDDLVIELVMLIRELNQINKKLDEIHRRIMAQHIKNKELQMKLKEQRMEHVSAKEQLAGALKSQQVNDALKLEASIVRSMLGHLIDESEVQWMYDERWLQVMLRIGEKIDL